MNKFFTCPFYFKIMLVLLCSISYSIIIRKFEIANILLLFTYFFVILSVVKVIKNGKRLKDYFFYNKDLGCLTIDNASYENCLKSLDKACSSKINGDELVQKFKDKYDCENKYYVFSTFFLTLTLIITAILILFSGDVLPVSSSILGGFFICIFIPIASVLMLSFQEYDTVERFTIYWEIKNSLSNTQIVIPNNSFKENSSPKRPIVVKVRLAKKVEAS